MTNPGMDGVKGTFCPARKRWRVRVHRKKFAAILKHETESGHDDAAAHAAIVTLNERDHIAFVVGRAHVNRVALIERRIAGLDFLRA